MGLFLVLLLTALWVSILLPGVYQSRRELSGANSVHSFQRAMTKLARRCGSTYQANPRPPGRRILVLDDAAGALARSRMRQRQRAALAQLGAAVFVTGVLAVFAGGLLWSAFGLSAAMLITYALAVAQVRAHQAERREKVRDIRRARQPTSAAPGGEHSNVRIRRWVV